MFIVAPGSNAIDLTLPFDAPSSASGIGLLKPARLMAEPFIILILKQRLLALGVYVP